MNKKKMTTVKSTMNLVMKDRPKGRIRNVLISALIFAPLVAFFAYFAVIVPFRNADDLQRQVAMSVQRLDRLAADNKIFDQVLEEYETYFIDTGTSTLPATTEEVLELIENELMSTATVQSVVFDKAEITVILRGIDLSGTSNLVKNLYESELVTSVSIASVNSTEESSVAMTISMYKEEESEEQ